MAINFRDDDEPEINIEQEDGDYSIVAYIVAKTEDGEIIGYGSAEIPDDDFKHIKDRATILGMRYFVEKLGIMPPEYGVGIIDHTANQLIVKHSDLPPHECIENDDPDALGVAPAVLPQPGDPINDTEEATKVSEIVERTITENGGNYRRVDADGNPVVTSDTFNPPTDDDTPETGKLKIRGE